MSNRLHATGLWLSLGLAALSTSPVRAHDGKFSVRAREHYEVQTVQHDDGATSYRGLTNTIGLGLEVPFRRHVGAGDRKPRLQPPPSRRPERAP